MDVKLATLIKSLNIMDVIFSGFTVFKLLYVNCYCIEACTQIETEHKKHLILFNLISFLYIIILYNILTLFNITQYLILYF